MCGAERYFYNDELSIAIGTTGYQREFFEAAIDNRD